MGKIDIIESVNQQSVNAMALHPNARCAVGNTTVSPGSQGNTNEQLTFSGQVMTMNCDVNAAGQKQNVGCNIQAPTVCPTVSDAGSVAAKKLIM